MAKKKQTDDALIFETPARTIKENDIVAEVEQMFVPFCSYVISDRAIPDAQDGLKPSQRRILYAMDKAGFNSSKPFIKSARAVAETMGNYHPHGDASIYQTLANMVRPYVAPVPLVSPKGSFGNRAGENASASRYTECRLTPVADAFMDDIKYHAVEMKPNFDERLEEPVVLPVMFPVLPINGAQGIAVGFATSCAPHNPDEIIDATIALIKKPKMTVDDLLDIVPGPDFPTGCDIIGIDGIRSAYETGKGIIKQRAKYHVAEANRGRHIIEFYEVPYGVSAEKIMADLNKLKEDGTIVGVTDILDLMDKDHPVNFSVYVKSGFDPVAIAEIILSNSPALYNTFAFNQTALLNNVPKVFSMIDMLQCFIDFRRDVITRRTKAQIKKIEHDKSLQEALDLVLLDIDKVINIVRTSDTNQQVYATLKKTFSLNDEQAKYIGDMRLIQLKKKDKLEIEKKIKALQKELNRLNGIIKSKQSLNKQLILELEDARKMISTPRKSKIVKKTIEAFDKQSAATKSKTATAVEKAQSMKIDFDASTVAYLNGNGELTTSTKPVPHVQKIDVNMNDTVLVIYEDGDSTRIPAHELGTSYALIGKKAAGISRYDEKAPVNVAMATSDGKVKVLDASTLTKNPDCPVMNLSSGTKILSARPVSGDNQQFVFVTSNANLLKFPVASVNPQGRTSAGVAGIKLVGEAKVVDAFVAEESDVLVTSTGKSIKVTPLSEYPAKGRGTQGVRCHKFLSGEDSLASAYVGNNPKRTDKKADLPKPAGRDASGTKQSGLVGATFGESD